MESGRTKAKNAQCTNKHPTTSSAASRAKENNDNTPSVQRPASCRSGLLGALRQLRAARWSVRKDYAECRLDKNRIGWWYARAYNEAVHHLATANLVHRQGRARLCAPRLSCPTTKLTCEWAERQHDNTIDAARPRVRCSAWFGLEERTDINAMESTRARCGEETRKTLQG